VKTRLLFLVFRNSKLPFVVLSKLIGLLVEVSTLGGRTPSLAERLLLVLVCWISSVSVSVSASIWRGKRKYFTGTEFAHLYDGAYASSYAVDGVGVFLTRWWRTMNFVSVILVHQSRLSSYLCAQISMTLQWPN